MRAPSAVVVGATDLDATASFLARFGFAEVSSSTLAGDHAEVLYGLEGPARTRLLGQPGARAGFVSLVETPHEGPVRGVFDHGPLAMDLYTLDLDADVAELEVAGVATGEVGRLEIGPLVMRQCQVTAPDGWRLVLVEANHRRPTRLDKVLSKDRHSEVHSQLWTVPDLDAAATPWIQSGLAQTHVFPIAHPELARILELPSPDTGLRMNLLVDEHQDPIRIELVEFPGQEGRVDDPADDLPLRAGVHALWFQVPDHGVPAAGRLTHVRQIDVPRRGRALAGRLGGVRVELWAPPA